MGDKDQVTCPKSQTIGSGWNKGALIIHCLMAETCCAITHTAPGSQLGLPSAEFVGCVCECIFLFLIALARSSRLLPIYLFFSRLLHSNNCIYNPQEPCNGLIKRL